MEYYYIFSLVMMFKKSLYFPWEDLRTPEDGSGTSCQCYHASFGKRTLLDYLEPILVCYNDSYNLENSNFHQRNNNIEAITTIILEFRSILPKSSQIFKILHPTFYKHNPSLSS